MKIQRIELHAHIQVPGLKNGSTTVLNDIDATFTQHGISVPFDVPPDGDRSAKAMEVLIPWPAVKFVTREREAKAK
jgi:hypothetical protein